MAGTGSSRPSADQAAHSGVSFHFGWANIRERLSRTRDWLRTRADRVPYALLIARTSPTDRR